MLTGSVCVAVQPVHSTAFLLLSDQSLMESPGSEEQPHTELKPPFPDDEDNVSLSHSPIFSSLAHSASSSPESNFTGSSKVAPSQLPKSQLHVVWCCQL